jgi:signal transduction histidine kinase
VILEYELPLAEPRHFEARLVRVGHDRVLSIVRDVTDAKRALALNQRLTGQLITAQENERARIALDLHDGVCQEVASVTVDVSYVRQRGSRAYSPETQEILLAVERRAAGVAETLRRLSHDLHPSVLQHVGLPAAMRAHCDELGRRHQLTITVSADDDCHPPHRVTALSLFRIVQEALHNAVEHGRARRAAVSLSRTADRLTLTVTDDGSGFDVAASRARGGLGLVSVEERARLARGCVRIRSEPGRGTTIEVDVPFDLEAGPSSPSTETESDGLGRAAPIRGRQPRGEELVTAGDAASQRE